MTLYEFNLLSENEQAMAVWQGEYITSREDRDYTIMLYKVSDFYVEVYYNKGGNDIVRFNPFKARRRLELYLKFSLN